MPVRRMVTVQSSNVAALGYDPGTKEMRVTFHDGSTYSYPGVTPVQFCRLLNATSIGKRFQELHRGGPFTKLEGG